MIMTAKAISLAHQEVWGGEAGSQRDRTFSYQAATLAPSNRKVTWYHRGKDKLAIVFPIKKHPIHSWKPLSVTGAWNQM